MTGSLLDAFQPGRRIYLPGASGELTALRDALAADPGRMRGVSVVSCLLPGMNTFDYTALDESAGVTTFLLPSALRRSFEAGRVRVLPLAYSAIACFLERDAGLDVAIAHVAAPDDSGRASLGIASDFTPIAWTFARQRIAVVNPRMPRMSRGPSIVLAEADLVIELDSPLIEAGPSREYPEITGIARAAASLIPDGASVQAGIGGAPGAIWRHLTGHRDIRIRSGMVTEDALALGPALAETGLHQAGIAYGSAAFYAALAEDRRITFSDTRETYDSAVLARTERFTAVNSALEVDLFGQANLEWQGGRLASGVGGAVDFARGATAAPGGRSIVLMPSTAARGTISRIVARISAPSVSIARNDIDTVVTEHGVAELRGLSLDERAKALVATAAPLFRDALEQDWRAMRAGF